MRDANYYVVLCQIKKNPPGLTSLTFSGNISFPRAVNGRSWCSRIADWN